MARSLFLLGRHKLGIDTDCIMYRGQLSQFYSSAIEAYKQAENRSEEEDWEILHNLGLCHLYTREWDAARESLVRALTLNEHQQTYAVLGRVHLMSGDVAGAVNVYKEAVK